MAIAHILWEVFGMKICFFHSTYTLEENYQILECESKKSMTTE